MFLDVILIAKEGAYATQQFGFNHFGLYKGATGEFRLIAQDLAPRNFMNPGLVNFQFPQLISQFVFIDARNKVGG